MQFDAFSYPAFEQITSHLAKMRNRTKGRVTLPDRHPHPLRGRHRRRRAPLRFVRGVLDAHPRPHGRHAVESGRRLLDAARGDRQRRPGHLPRAEEPLLGEGRRSRFPFAPLPMTSGQVLREGSDVTLLAYGPRSRRRCRPPSSASVEGLVDRGHRPAQPVAVRRRDGRRIRSQDLARRDHPRGCAVRRLRRRGRRASDRARSSSTSPRPSCGSPASTSRSRSPKLEEHYLPTAERVLAALDTWEW